MTEQNTQLAKQADKTIKGLLQGDAFKEQLKNALPRHLTPDRFVRVAMTAMTKTPKLQKCTPQSFFQCLLTLSASGLEPDGRQAHLIPFENRKQGTVDCQLIVDYKGLIELVQRSGKISYVHADTVCENDVFEYSKGNLEKHTIDFKNPRGEPYAFYALARFKDGSEKCEVMTLDEVKAIQKRSRSGNSGPWQTDFNEMAKKTVFRRLSKWLPLSPEMKDVIDADMRAEFDDFRNAKPAQVVENALPVFEEPADEEPNPVIEGEGKEGGAE